MILTTALSRPPAVLREVKGAEVLANTYESLYQYPTFGPAVKHFSLSRSRKTGNVLSNDCVECGKEVGQFLTKLLFTGTGKHVSLLEPHAHYCYDRPLLKV